MKRIKILIFLTALLGLNCAHRIDPAALRLADRQNIEISIDQTLATPTLVRGKLADLSTVKSKKQAKPLRQFFKENPDIFKLVSPDDELRLLRRDVDKLGFTHYRYERLHNGLPIYGDELVLHVNNKSEVYQFNGRYHPSPTVSSDSVRIKKLRSLPPASNPAITAAQAEKLALEQGKAHKMQSIDKNTLLYYPIDDRLRLAYQVILRGGMNQWDYFIDAEDGRVLFEQDRRRFQAEGIKK